MLTVTVTDTEPPVIVTPPDILVLADLEQCSAVVNYSVDVSDNLPGTTIAFEPRPSPTACQAKARTA